MRKRLAIFVCLSVILIFSSVASSKIVLWPLSEMVKQADTIAIGTVVEIEKTNEKTNEFPLSKATISIEKILKGDPDTKSINVYFLPGFEDEARYALNDRSIFFIRKYQGKDRLVQGHAGKIDIKDNAANNIFISKEPRNQQLDSFIKKIENVSTHTTRLSEKKVVALANREAIKKGFDLSKFEKPKATFQLTNNDKMWTVFYNGKIKMPGNHFLVWVNDATSECKLMLGE